MKDCINRFQIAMRGIFTLLCSIFVCAQCYAAAPLTLESEPDFYVALTPHLEVYIDDSAQLSLDDIQLADDKFSPVTTPYPDFGLTNGRVWLRAILVNEMDQQSHWRVNINRQYYKSVAIDLIDSDGEIRHVLTSTNQDKFNDRDIKHRIISADISLKPGEKAWLYINYTTASTSYMPVGIGTAEAVAVQHSQEHMVNWMLNGALLAMITFALILTPAITGRLAVSFSLYILAGFIFVLHADGYTFQYLWPEQKMAINDPLNLSFMALMPVFGVIFSREMFGFKGFVPRFDLCLKVIITTAIIIALLSFQLYSFNLSKVLAYAFIPVATLSPVIAGIIAFQYKRLGAIPYCVGALFVFLSFLYSLIAHVFPGHFNLDATLDFGHVTLIIECVAFGIAMVLRLKGLREERDDALRAELTATHEKLKLSSDLRKTQADYIAARQLSDKRRENLSAVSHDLQQPLASLRSALARIDGAKESQIQQMQKAFDYLETLARDNLKTADTDPGNHEASAALYETFALRIVLDNVYEMLSDEARAKGLILEYLPCGASVQTDPVLLMRAVVNLVSNAIKHTQTGTVTLSAQIETQMSGQLVYIDVVDTGEGMSAHDLDRLQKTYQKTQRSNGNGLGLPIVQAISDQLGLNFEIKSTPGSGTRCRLYVPILQE